MAANLARARLADDRIHPVPPRRTNRDLMVHAGGRAPHGAARDTMLTCAARRPLLGRSSDSPDRLGDRIRYFTEPAMMP
ncbi:hypothetical protein [Streptomyces tubercidicus]|uniref:hypothetical protein n=1 Tax=Streptomyces tubercidicus TaxID=47759 RepID=UPI00369088A8